jgi:hypothetical protein
MENLTAKKRERELITVSVIVPLFFVSILWLVYFSEVAFGWDLSSFGIFPRHFSALAGIFFYSHSCTGASVT